MAAMNQRRSQAASAVCNDRIYVFGGFDNDLTVNTATDIVECYDVDKNKWTLVRYELFILSLSVMLWAAACCSLAILLLS